MLTAAVHPREGGAAVQVTGRPKVEGQAFAHNASQKHGNLILDAVSDRLRGSVVTPIGVGQPPPQPVPTSGPPAGFYADPDGGRLPDGSVRKRWWDGVRWTEHFEA